MNKNVSVGVRGGKPAKGVAPCGTIGLQRVTTSGYREPKVGNPISVPLGNQLTTNVGKGGPGAGRTVHPTGSQSTAPKAQPMSGTGAGWPWTK